MTLNRKTLAIIVSGLFAFVAMGGVLRATVRGPNADTFKICVDEDGEVRFLGSHLGNDDDDNDEDGSNTTCGEDEVLYELASGHSVSELKLSLESLNQIVQLLEANIADLASGQSVDQLNESLLTLGEIVDALGISIVGNQRKWDRLGPEKIIIMKSCVGAP